MKCVPQAGQRSWSLPSVTVSGFIDLDFRNRDYPLPTSLLEERFLLDDFRGEVPREADGVVRHISRQHPVRHNGNVCSRGKPVLLLECAINNVIQVFVREETLINPY